jgi:Tol biopolymer transport system component
VSPDTTRLAFAAKSKHTQIWVLPFDAALGRISGKGYRATSSGLDASLPSLSSDGTKLAFVVRHGGVDQVWQKSLMDEHEYPVIVDDYFRDFPQWSRDGKRLLYRRFRVQSGISEGQLVVWSETERKEEPLTPWSTSYGAPYDWSADGQWVLASKWDKTFHPEVWEIPTAGTVHAATSARSIVSHPSYQLYQAHFSPDGRWVVFEAVDLQPAVQESVIYVAPHAGGPWVRITENNHWSDKPRWSLDGKTIYYVTDQNGFLNVWGIRFDPATGKPVGRPLQVTAFNTPSLMFPSSIEPADISLGRGKLALTLEQASGSIWMLDIVDE